MALLITRREGERTLIGDVWLTLEAVDHWHVELSAEYPDGTMTRDRVNFRTVFPISEGVDVMPKYRKGNQVQLAIEAPQSIKILREELVA